jgi:capsid portal protein
MERLRRDDMLAALRIPPQLMGIVPQNAGGFADSGTVAAVNDWVGEEVVKFTA